MNSGQDKDLLPKKIGEYFGYRRDAVSSTPEICKNCQGFVAAKQSRGHSHKAFLQLKT